MLLLECFAEALALILLPELDLLELFAEEEPLELLFAELLLLPLPDVPEPVLAEPLA